jgi:hypothetical protein
MGPTTIALGLLIIVGALLIFKKIQDRRLLNSVTKRNRGTKSERDLVLKLLKYGIPKQTIFHDLYVKKSNGNFTQIDLVVATTVGIIVFEIKEYSGWIFGTGYKPQWTQVLAYGKQKYRFYNPIMQNNKHINDLSKQLKENVPFYSIIVFYGDCELKDISFVPNGTFIVKSKRVLEVMRVIMKNNEPAKYIDKHKVVRILKESVENGGSKLTQNQHIENIKEMMGKDRIYD